MSDEESTTPLQLEGSSSPGEPGPSAGASTWTLSWGPRVLSSLPLHTEAISGAAENRDGASTLGPQKIDVPDRSPRQVPAITFGRRGLRPVYQWEGEVEDVNGEGFTARLVPVEGGTPIRSKTEFTDFYFDDLADPSERVLVVPGAVFYWTLGRAKNEAGTITNTSLVRFRRLPPPGIYQRKLAEDEARELILKFGEQSST